MNLFRDIKSAVNKLNSYGNMTHQENFIGQKNDQITQTIKICTYTNEVKSAIEKSIRHVLNTFKFYRAEVLQFVENGQQKRYVELKGQFIVQKQGKILFHIMYPAAFPQYPPLIRIINPNPAQFISTQFYRSLQSSTDQKSYVVNDRLQQVKNWKPSKQVTNLIIEVNTIVKNNFPFQKINKQTLMNSWSTGQLKNPQNVAYQNQNNQASNWTQNVAQKQPPIPFRPINSAQSILAKSKLMVGNQQKTLQTMKTKHQQLLSKIQFLDNSNYSIQSEHAILIKENENMSRFIEFNSNERGIQNISDIFRTSDQLSEQILDLTSSIIAREDCVHFVQTRFNEQKITFQEFMKQIRKIEQAKFEDKALLVKCLQNH